MLKTEEIWLQFGEQLKFFILKKIKDKSIADDILQEVFIKIHANIKTLKDDQKIRAWIYQITRNSIIDFYRANEKNASLSFDLSEDNQEEDENLNFEIASDLREMMNELSDKYCDALCMTEFDGLSQKQYAEKVGISYSAAKARVQRAKKMLKDELMKCCHFQFDKYGTILDYHPNTCCCCEESSQN